MMKSFKLTIPSDRVERLQYIRRMFPQATGAFLGDDWRGGTREGASAIIDASINMETFDRELGREICNAGIHTTTEVEPDMRSPQHMAVRVTEIIGEILFAGKFPIMIGGEHSLTFGAVAAALKLPLDGDITVLQLDAHTDLRDTYCETKWGHGCVARRMSELPGVKILRLLQILLLQ